jgi:peptide/nickel transport system substrate-binding protein
MTLLIDRERLANELYYGHAMPSAGPFGYGSPQSDPEVKPWPHDPARARELLAEAGWTDRDGNGTLENAQNRPLQFTLSYGAGSAFTDRMVLYIKDTMAKAGIRVELDAVDWPILVKKLDTRDFEACMLGWSTSVETDPNQIFHSAQTKDGGDNFVNYVNPELDRAIELARATVNEDERMKAWNAVHRIIHDDQPYTFMLIRQSLGFLDGRIENIRKSKIGLNHVLTEVAPLPWYVPKDRQLHTTP